MGGGEEVTIHEWESQTIFAIKKEKTELWLEWDWSIEVMGPRWAREGVIRGPDKGSKGNILTCGWGLRGESQWSNFKNEWITRVGVDCRVASEDRHVWGDTWKCGVGMSQPPKVGAVAFGAPNTSIFTWILGPIAICMFCPLFHSFFWP